MFSNGKVFKFIFCVHIFALYILFTFIFSPLHHQKSTSRPVKTFQRVPNILWKRFDYNNNNTTLLFAKKETLSCPIQDGESIECNVFVSWEDYPTNIDAYISYATAFFIFPEHRDPNTLWGMIFDESARVNPFVLNEKFLNLFNFSATYSRYSDVPFPLFYFIEFSEVKRSQREPGYSPFKSITSKKYYVTTKKKNFYLGKIAPVLYLQSSNCTFVNRDQYVLKLMEYIAVDSCGETINNKRLPKDLKIGSETNVPYLIRSDKFWKYTARYKFQIAIESSVCSDYITEKLWRPIVQGVVPIYFGSPTVRDWLPNEKSAILIEDFATPELLAEYLKELLSNDTKYEEHLEHKTKGIITNQKLLEELKNHPNRVSELYDDIAEKFKCLLCQKLHEDRLNSSKVNIVTRKALDCKMPYSILTHAPDLNNPFLTLINKNMRAVDNVHDKYMNRQPIAPTELKWATERPDANMVKMSVLNLLEEWKKK